MRYSKKEISILEASLDKYTKGLAYLEEIESKNHFSEQAKLRSEGKHHVSLVSYLGAKCVRLL